MASLTPVALLLGLLLATAGPSGSLRPAFSEVRAQDLPRSAVTRLEEEQRALKGQVESLQREIQAYQRSAASRTKTLSEISAELERQRLIAGMLALEGPGVKVILDDSLKKPSTGEDLSLYIVHDFHLRDVVNLLWEAGAEAISINEERIVGSTSIYGAGSTILVNNTRLSPPYEVRALGNASYLYELLSNPGVLYGLKSRVKQYGLQLNIQRADALTLPAYKGALTLRYASISGGK